MHVPQHVTAQPRRVESRPWFAAASLGGALALSVGAVLSVRAIEEPTTMPRAKTEEAKDGGTVALGDSALTAPMALVQPPSMWSAITLDVPPKPIPGQSRPDATGRCPHKSQVVINGGCWMKLAVDMKNCDEKDYVYKSGCYAPAFPPARLPTSSPANRTDGP